MSEAKRKKIKERIEAGEARNEERVKTMAERAEELREQATDFARAHPIALIAGGLAVGVAISALFPKSPTRRIGKQVGSKAAHLATLAAEFAILYGERALDAAQDAGRVGMDHIEDFSDAAGDKARALKREAAYLAGNASDKAKSITRDTGKKASRAMRGRLN